MIARRQEVRRTRRIGELLGGAPALRWRFERVARGFSRTEGPAWDGSSVIFSDIPSNRIMRYLPGAGTCSTLFTDTRGTNGLALDASGALYGCQGAGRCVVRYEPDGTAHVLAESFDGDRLNGPSDLVVDSGGRIWFSDPRRFSTPDPMELDHGSVYRLDPAVGGYRITRATTDTVRPNGLGLSPDERTLYVAETTPDPGRRELRAYPIGSDGALSSPRVLHGFPERRGPDGLAVDAAGRVYVACGGRRTRPGPRIAVFSPSGELLEQHPLKEEPTNLCFSGTDVYVTTMTGELLRASLPDRVATDS